MISSHMNNVTRAFWLLVGALLMPCHSVLAQNSLTSVRINLQHFTLSSDRKTLSYDVYLQDVDAANPIAIPGFLMRLAIPLEELGTSPKRVEVTNTSLELGATGVTASMHGSNWLFSFTQANLITSYNGALRLSETFPGTRIGTFNISNDDGSPFDSPLSITATHSGEGPMTKSTVAIFKPGTTELGSNTSVAQPAANFTGLGDYLVSASKIPLTISGTTVTLKKTYDGTKVAEVTQVGTLSGLIKDESVEVQATAAYVDANAGTGKTITVSYTLSGPDADHYVAPKNDTLTNGEIVQLFTLKAYLEGLWNDETRQMNKCQAWDAEKEDLVDQFPGDIAERVTIELHTSDYRTIAYTFSDLEWHQDGRITSPGATSILLPGYLSGSYYLTIKTRNHLETTSAAPVHFTANTVAYDFTDNVTKAYTSDLTFPPVKPRDAHHLLYAGDVITDTDYPEINMSDLYEVFNNRSALTDTFGYLTLDLNGDGFIDEADLYTLFANMYIYFFKE